MSASSERSGAELPSQMSRRGMSSVGHPDYSALFGFARQACGMDTTSVSTQGGCTIYKPWICRHLSPHPSVGFPSILRNNTLEPALDSISKCL